MKNLEMNPNEVVVQIIHKENGVRTKPWRTTMLELCDNLKEQLKKIEESGETEKLEMKEDYVIVLFDKKEVATIPLMTVQTVVDMRPTWEQLENIVWEEAQKETASA